MKTLNEIQTQKIVDFLSKLHTEVPIIDYVNLEDIDMQDAYESIYEAIQENNGFNIEIIYYHTAIDYLKENDPSLRESLELAGDMGFELKNLTSETLASLLASNNAIETFGELQDEINEFFIELNEELNELQSRSF